MKYGVTEMVRRLNFTGVWRIDLEGRLLGLADLLDDLFVAGAQLEVAVGLLVDDVGPGSTDDETLCRQRGIGSDLTVIG
jgi:hypothetical protein